MNKDEIIQQINKYKARRLKSRLAHYSLLTSILLTLSVFASGISTTTLTALVLILPVPSYFALQSLKLSRKANLVKAKLENLKIQIDDLPNQFSFIKFLTQPNLAFRLTLILFFIVAFTSFARLRSSSNSPSITYNTQINHR